MLVQGIKSRPVYPGFVVDLPAQRHLFALEGEGALALLDKVQPGHRIMDDTEIMFVADAQAETSQADLGEALLALHPAEYWCAPTLSDLTGRLGSVLAAASMGLRLYSAGTEAFIGAVVVVAAGRGIKHSSIITEHRGSMRRRVQCVHCKAFTDNVTISPVPCAHCGLHLVVRDHFSRRLNAFQGVCANAEEPDVVPSPEELFR